jgi:hypothetical protein
LTVSTIVEPENQSVLDRSLSIPSVRSLLPWLVAGGIIRVVLAPFTSHPYDMAAWISHQLRLFDAGLNPFFNWKYSAPMLALLLLTYLPVHATTVLFHVPQILAQQFWIKTPFIAADLILAVVLGRCVGCVTRSQSAARLASILWLFNPVAIFFTAVHGQVDALSAALLLIAVLFLFRGSESKALASALGAGVAKYAGFILVPFIAVRILSSTDRKLATLVKILAACFVVVGVAFTPGILVNGGLLGGVKSSIVSGTELSSWSIWGLLGRAQAKELSRAWLILWVAWYVLLLWRFARSPARISDPLSLVRAASSALAMLIALDPFANPQFLLWVMPLALLLAFADQSSLRLALVVVIGLLNLVTLFTLLNPDIWLLNAIPNANVASFDASLLTGTFHADLARAAGVAYAIALMAMAVIDAVGMGPGRRGEHVFSAAWRWAEGLAIAQGVGIAMAFALFVFQPALMSRYEGAPSYPVDLDLVNSFPADHVEWAGTNLRADWSNQVARFAEGNLNQASVEVVAQGEHHPAVTMTQAGTAVSVEQQGVAEQVLLPYVGDLLRIELLLGNPSFGARATPLPNVRLSLGQDPPREVGVAISVERAVVPGWFTVRVDPTDLLPAHSFTIDVSAPDGSGWVWNGAGAGGGVAGVSVLGPRSDVGDRWIEAWAVPRNATSGGGLIGLTQENNLEELHSFGESASLTSVSFNVSREISRSRPLVSLRLDIRQHGELPPSRLAAIGAASIAYLILFALLTVVVTRLGVRETGARPEVSDDQPDYPSPD